MKSIYTIYISVKDQEQANRLKAICLEYGLPILDKQWAFVYKKDIGNSFYYIEGETNGFGLLYDSSKTESTEEEFINILKEMKK